MLKSIPVILRLFGYKYLFYSNESDEPPHIHIRKGNAHAKFWIEPVSLAKNEGFKTHQLILCYVTTIPYKFKGSPY